MGVERVGFRELGFVLELALGGFLSRARDLGHEVIPGLKLMFCRFLGAGWLFRQDIKHSGVLVPGCLG